VEGSRGSWTTSQGAEEDLSDSDRTGLAGVNEESGRAISIQGNDKDGQKKGRIFKPRGISEGLRSFQTVVLKETEREE